MQELPLRKRTCHKSYGLSDLRGGNDRAACEQRLVQAIRVLPNSRSVGASMFTIGLRLLARRRVIGDVRLCLHRLRRPDENMRRTLEVIAPHGP